MPGLIQGSPTRRSLVAFWAIGALLGAAGLASSVVEDVSFRHVHLVDGHVVHHNHFYLGPHEHSAFHSLAGPDDDHDDHDPHSPGAPHPHGHPAPQRTATLSTAPALFQPVAFWAPAAPEAPSAPVAPAPATSSPARPVGPPSRPRAPPALSTSRGLPSSSCSPVACDRIASGTGSRAGK